MTDLPVPDEPHILVLVRLLHATLQQYRAAHPTLSHHVYTQAAAWVIVDLETGAVLTEPPHASPNPP
jgi:hypothetical protein